jgi:hypothetical protein
MMLVPTPPNIRFLMIRESAVVSPENTICNRYRLKSPLCRKGLQASGSRIARRWLSPPRKRILQRKRVCSADLLGDDQLAASRSSGNNLQDAPHFRLERLRCDASCSARRVFFACAFGTRSRRTRREFERRSPGRRAPASPRRQNNPAAGVCPPQRYTGFA